MLKSIIFLLFINRMLLKNFLIRQELGNSNALMYRETRHTSYSIFNINDL